MFPLVFEVGSGAHALQESIYVMSPVRTSHAAVSHISSQTLVQRQPGTTLAISPKNTWETV
jgi:hypothetical protein